MGVDGADGRGEGDELARLRSLLDTAQRLGRLAVWERDAATGEGRWDPLIFEFFGLPAGDASPDFQAAMALLEPQDRERVRREYQESLARPGRHETRYRVHRPDGRDAWLHSIWQVPEAGTRVTGIVVDDTESLRLQQRHEVLRTQLSLLTRLSRMSLWRTDLATQRIFRGEELWPVTGLEPGDAGIPVEAMRALIHPDDIARSDAASRAALEGEVVAAAETRFRASDGQWRTLLTQRIAQRDADGRPVAVIGAGMDITEQVAERERYRRLAEQFDLVVEAAGIGLWQLDLETGEQHWNAEMRRIYGLPPDAPVPAGDAVGISAPVLEEDRPAVAAALERVLAADAPQVEARWRVRRPDGSVRTLVGCSRRLGGGSLLAGAALDVTELQHAEQAMREKHAAERASREKSDFLSRMSHELRTPLNAVLGFAELLLLDDRDALTSRQRERLEQVRRAGQHLLALIDDVLDLARLDAQGLGPGPHCEIGAALEAVLPWIRPQAEAAGVALQVQAEPAAASPGVPLTVPGDVRHWRQVLSNLLSNAVKFNRPGGKVEIRLRRNAGGGACIEVADTGRGLSAGQRARLFQPFDRLGAEREGIPGTGIGLTVVQRIVAAAGGRIDVQSEPGQGTTVRLELPAVAAAAPAPAAAAPADPPQEAPASAADIVYIEDNPVNLLLVEQVLAQRPQWRLHGAGSLADGEALVRRVRPALVLVDIHLPDGDGSSLPGRLRTGPQPLHTPCIALSADALPAQVQRTLAAGFLDYWTKPIDTQRLLDDLDRQLGAVATGG